MFEHTLSLFSVCMHVCPNMIEQEYCKQRADAPKNQCLSTSSSPDAVDRVLQYLMQQFWFLECHLLDFEIILCRWQECTDIRQIQAPPFPVIPLPVECVTPAP